MVNNLLSRGDSGSVPRLGRSPGEGNGDPLQWILPGEFYGQRSLVGYSLWVPKSSILRLGRSPGKANGHPCQHSYLESSMDRRAWRAIVYVFQRVGHS